MNIHLFNDPLGKYLELFYRRMTPFDEKALFFNLADSPNKLEGVKYFGSKIEAFEEYILNLNKVSKVFFHPYNQSQIELLSSLKTKHTNLKSYWVVWSKEIHENRLVEESILRSFSKRYKRNKYKRNNFFIRTAKIFLKELFFRVFPQKDTFKCYLQSFKNIDFVCCLFEEEFSRIKEISNASFKHLEFTYNDLESIIGEKEYDLTVNKDKIMIGHSADSALNHFEILSQLNDLGISSIIYLPLAYGDMEYKRILLNSIREFNLTLHIVDNTLSSDTYKLELQKVNCAIFNIKIQQGLGNIFILLWMGCRVFLDEQSVVYSGLKKANIIVNGISEINKKTLCPLNIEEQRHNRNSLEGYIGKEVVNSQYATLLN